MAKPNLKWAIAVVLVLGFTLGCGRHRSENRFTTQAGDVFKGTKPSDPAGRMQEAIGLDDVATVEQLLNDGWPVDEIFPNGRTALIEATIQSKYRIMIQLLKRGATKDLRAKDGKSALEIAREVAGVDDKGQPLINRSVLILDEQSQLLKREELMRFTVRGSADPLLRLLKDVGVDPNFVDASGKTPLTAAIHANKLISVQVLAHWKDCPSGEGKSDCIRITATDLNLPGADGKKPKTLAKGPGREQIFNLLSELNAEE
jgi:hypothetical protein